MTGKTEMTKNMTKKPTKNDKLNIWTISRVWLRVSSNDTAMSGNFWITFSFLLWCLSWTFAAAIGMGLACQWQCIDGEMHQFYFGTWKNVINRPVWRSPSVDFPSLSHKERMDGTNLRVWLNASKRFQIHWEHWSLKIPYWKQLRFGSKNNPSGLFLTGHRSVSGFPAPYGCGWCRLPSQASSPGWCSWVWWSQRTASWQMEHGGTDHPPCLGLFGGPNRKPLGFVIDVLGSIVGSQMLGLS